MAPFGYTVLTPAQIQLYTAGELGRYDELLRIG